MATVIDQVNELADLQGRSAAILTLARHNAEVRGNIGRKTAQIAAQLKQVGEVLNRAKLVADRVVGANEKQTEHLNNLETALNQAPTAEELDEQVDTLSALAMSLEGGPPAAPPSNLSADAPAFVPAAPPAGGYRYSRRRKTPTRRKTATRKRTPSRRRRKHKTHHRR
jgi:hypothetical protein